MGIFGGSAQDDVDLRGLQDRLARLEQAVASLQAQVGALTGGAVAAAPPMAAGTVPYANVPDPTAAVWMQEVRQLKESGKLINAIKVYREHTGVGLREAKDAVEGML